MNDDALNTTRCSIGFDVNIMDNINKCVGKNIKYLHKNW